MTDPNQHNIETPRNTSLPNGVNIHRVRAPDMLWIRGVVYGATEYTIREFRDPPCHEMIDVI